MFVVRRWYRYLTKRCLSADKETREAMDKDGPLSFRQMDRAMWLSIRDQRRMAEDADKIRKLESKIEKIRERYKDKA